MLHQMFEPITALLVFSALAFATLLWLTRVPATGIDAP